jgi:hypothetical protein
MIRWLLYKTPCVDFCGIISKGYFDFKAGSLDGIDRQFLVDRKKLGDERGLIFGKDYR